MGVWRNPAVGGTHRREGGNFVFISGRPYRYHSDHLRSNIEYILQNFFNEPYLSGSDSEDIYLYQNYPNPFNLSTTIRFQIPESQFVTLEIYTILGEKVITLLSASLLSGPHAIDWDASGFSSGVYYYQLAASDYREVKKMVLLR